MPTIGIGTTICFGIGPAPVGTDSGGEPTEFPAPIGTESIDKNAGSTSRTASPRFSFTTYSIEEGGQTRRAGPLEANEIQPPDG